MKMLITIGIFVLTLAGSVTAQENKNCPKLAEEAIILLNDAQTAIDANDTDSASTSISEAQNILFKCNPDTQVTDNNIETDSPVDENNTQSTDTTTESVGNFIINAPEINPQHSISFLQFSNWSPDIGNLDFYLGNNSTPIVENIAFQEVTNPIVINGGNHSITARPAGSGSDGEVLHQLGWNFQGNSSWIVSGIGLQSETAFFIEPISIIRTNYDDKARVRIVNLIATRQNVTVTTDSDVMLANGIGWVGLKDSMLDATSLTLQVELEDGTQFDSLLTQDIEANNTYTVVLTGMNTDEQPVHAVMIKSPENITRVKFISNRSDAVEIFIMPDGIEVVDQLEPDTETDWISLPSGAMSFILYSPDSGPTSQELAGISRQFRPGRDVTIIVDDSNLNISEEAITP